MNLIPDGPQNIEGGEIKFNGVVANDGFKQYRQWKDYIIKVPVVTDVYISHLMCSSAEVVNSVLDDIGRLIWPGRGLNSIEIFYFRDRNTLMQWPLSQFAAQSHHLQILEINHLETTEENIDLIMDFSAEVATISYSLKSLFLRKTGSS